MRSTLLGSGFVVILLENSIDICLDDWQLLLFGLGLTVLGVDCSSLFYKGNMFCFQILRFRDDIHAFIVKILLCSLVDQDIFFVFCQIFFGVTGPDIPIVNFASLGVFLNLLLGDGILLDGIVQQSYFFSQGIAFMGQFIIQCFQFCVGGQPMLLQICDCFGTLLHVKQLGPLLKTGSLSGMNGRFKIDGELDLLVLGDCTSPFLRGMGSLPFYDGPENFRSVVFAQGVHTDMVFLFPSQQGRNLTTFNGVPGLLQ